MNVLERLHAMLADEGGLAQSLVDVVPGDARPAFGPLAAAGARSRTAAPEYELLVESIFEGYLLHFAHGRIVVPADGDLCLLAGDHLYALGLARLAELGDLDAVEELADLISLSAHVHAQAAETGASAWQTTGALWSLAALAVAGGGWDAQRKAKRRARERGTDALAEALGAARERALELGLGKDLDRGLIACEVAVTRIVPTT